MKTGHLQKMQRFQCFFPHDDTMFLSFVRLSVVKTGYIVVRLATHVLLEQEHALEGGRPSHGWKNNQRKRRKVSTDKKGTFLMFLASCFKVWL